MHCCFALLLTLSAFTQPEGPIRIGTRDVHLVFPSTPKSASIPPSAAHISQGAWNFLVFPNGQIGRRYQSDGLWGQARALWAAASTREGPKSTWKVKVFLLTRADILDVGSDGMYRVRRSTIETNQLDSVYRELALFKVAAEGWSGGRLSLQFDVAIDNEPFRWRTDESLQALLRQEFAPRINGAIFETDDKVDRGPYDSVFAISALPTTGLDFDAAIGQPMSFVSYYVEGGSDEEGALAVHLTNKWVGHVARGAKRQGFRVDDQSVLSSSREFLDPGRFMTDGMWQVVSNRTDPSDPAFVARRWPQDTVSGKPWNEVAGDTAIKLPFVQTPDAKDMSGSFSVPREGKCWATLFAADLIAGSIINPVAVGQITAPLATEILFSIPGVDAITPSTLGKPVEGTLAWYEPRPPENATFDLRPKSYGNFVAQVVQDDTKGPCIEVTETKGTRSGSVVLFESPEGVLIDPSKNTVLEFGVLPSSSESYRLLFLAANGDVIAEIGLGSGQRPPAETGQASPAPFVPLKTGEWNSIAINLADWQIQAADKRAPSAVVLTRPRWADFWERQVGGTATVRIAGFKVRPLGAGEVVAAPVLQRPPSAAEARAAQTIAMREPLSDSDKVLLRELLVEKNELVRLNACAVLTRAAWTEAVPMLIDQAKSASPQIAQMAMKALAHQNTNEAWGAILLITGRGPFDFNQHYAAEALAGKPEEPIGPPLTSLMTTKSYHARAAAARTLGRIPGEGPAILRISMLQEIDPYVRFAVTQGSNVSVELVNRRLLWASVNDSSEAVRAASLLELMKSPIAEYKSEGFKGIRNESKPIRLFLLDQFKVAPSEAQRPALQLAVTDASAVVRAKALEVLAELPGAIQLTEIENTLRDVDPRVQRALLDLAKKKALTLPTATIELLRDSPDPEVADKAKLLG